ncbi:pachytene checkpoint protein 2 homolog isoform X2 [Python bivittatus]|uniref:Pachytene checkpoint protein 2 homolog n=1 Tax=Python bivittatus TaxID=176946 RepID=A0A9F5MZL7_PYTBI|nr:pachytene checkpoint protein 2 homolog isoform X2 [Python bivittatus]
MDEAAGDLKLPLQNDCESLQIHVEVHQKTNSTAKKEDIKLSVLKLLNRHSVIFGDYKWIEFDDCFLTNNVQSIAVVDTELQLKERQPISLNKCRLLIHIFHLNEEGPSTENLDAEDEDIVAANHWLLPAVEFHCLWESLIYDAEIKSDLLNYVTTTLLFSDRNVNNNLISWNRVILLHGPPGTGKTSLCRAMAQKLTIRLSHRYRYGQLIEINSHSLFSKWFSESGKLVTKMFQKIQELIDDKDVLVFVLIDEVESLTAARSAFQADRADIKQYIGPPSPAAVFKIYHSCLEELMKCQIIYPRQQLLTLHELEMIGYLENDVSKLSLLLKDISRKSEGLSGRILRKLPFLAHALHIQSPSVTMTTFLQALSLAVDKQFEERAKLSDCA